MLSESDSSVSSADVRMTLNRPGATAAHGMSGSPHTPAFGTKYKAGTARSRNASKSSTKVSVRDGDARQTPRSNARQKPPVVSSSSSDSDCLDNSPSHHGTSLRNGKAVSLISDGRRLTRSSR